MAHNVFISYSKVDKLVADAVCARLEQANIRCWIAPRDSLAGDAYAKSIIDAINASSVMVVVFSVASDESRFVLGEVERAFSKGIAILPFRIEDHKPSGAMELFLNTSHWLDALSPPLEHRIGELVTTVEKLLAKSLSQNSATRQVPREPEGLEGTSMLIRQLPRPARRILALRCLTRLKFLLFSSWSDGNYMYETIDFINDTFLPTAMHLAQTNDSRFQSFLGESRKKINNGLETATRTSQRQSAHAVVIACLTTYVTMIEAEQNPLVPLEKVVFQTYNAYGLVNPDNSIVRHELREEVDWLLQTAISQGWSDESQLPETISKRPLWNHGWPAHVNGSIENRRSVWSLISDLWS